MPDTKDLHPFGGYLPAEVLHAMAPIMRSARKSMSAMSSFGALIALKGDECATWMATDGKNALLWRSDRNVLVSAQIAMPPHILDACKPPEPLRMSWQGPHSESMPEWMHPAAVVFTRVGVFVTTKMHPPCIAEYLPDDGPVLADAMIETGGVWAGNEYRLSPTKRDWLRPLRKALDGEPCHDPLTRIGDGSADVLRAVRTLGDGTVRLAGVKSGPVIVTSSARPDVIGLTMPVTTDGEDDVAGRWRDILAGHPTPTPEATR